MYMVGTQVGEVFSEKAILSGRGASPGTRARHANGREFVMVKVGSGQNLTNGLAVTFNGSTYVTTLGTVAPAGIPSIGPVAIVHCSITASTSMCVWAQVYGLCNIASFASTVSAVPGAAVKFGANGLISANSVTTASQYIAGMTVFATVSVVGAGSVFLNYPSAVSGGNDPAPTVTSVTANSGTSAGGTSVTIAGTNFNGTTAVTFGGNAATSVVVVSRISITCTTPAHSAGAVNVVVTTPNGSGTGTNAFTYT